MKLALPILIISVLLGGAYFVFLKPEQAAEYHTSNEKPMPQIISSTTDFTASFAIFTNGTFRVFTAAMYHNLDENIYIESPNPNIVRVKQAGTTWDDFFKTLPFSLTKDCLTTGSGETFCSEGDATLKFYINGDPAPDALSQEIKSGDKLLVSYGSENLQEIQYQLEQIPQTE